MSLQAEAPPFVPREPSAATTDAGAGSSRPGGRKRHNRRAPAAATQTDGANSAAPPSGGRASAPARSLQQLQAADASQARVGNVSANTNGDNASQGAAPKARRRRPPKVKVPTRTEDEANGAAGSSQGDATPSSTPNPSRRKKQFGARLTDGASPAFTRSPAPHMTSTPISTADMDLTTRLIHSFTHKEDGLDCPICFASIHPAQPIWSCSPGENTESCCWTTFHLKCIRSWAEKS